MKKKPVFLGMAIALFFAIFAGLVFLPAILSGDMLKARLLQEINHRLPGKLQVEQWGFEWFGGIEAKGISYDLRQQNLLINIANLKVYHGLIRLVANPRNLGGIEVVEPEVVFFLRDKALKEPSHKAAFSQTAGLPVFSGLLKITDGSIRTVKPDHSEKMVVRDLDLFLDLADVAKPIAYRVFLLAGDKLGRLAAEGTMTLSADDPFNLSKVQSDARLKITNFISADGRGDLSHLQATLSADLAAALRELKKFVDIKEWDGSGQLFAKLQFKETSPRLNNGSLNLEIRHLALSRNGHPILPQQDLKAGLTASIQQGEHPSASEFYQPNLTLQSSMVRGNFSAARFKLSSKGNLPTADNLSIDGRFDLQQISALLRNFNKLPASTRMAGNAHIQAGGSMAEQTLVLDGIRIEARNFRYRNENKAVREDQFILKTKGNLNFNKKSAFFAPVEAGGSPGTLVIPELTVSDWTNFEKDLKTGAKANFDLAKLIEGYGDFIGLPENTRVSGKGQFDLEVDFSSPQAQFLKVDANLSPLAMTSDALPPISEDHVKLKADLKRSSDGKSLSIENIELKSTPLLVGDKAYRYLEGTTIAVPIRGSSSNPDIDKATMQKASADMAQQALQKTLEKGVQNIFEQIIKKVTV